jgi:site-specific DNA-methyltransferase (adenine-specific)
VIEKIVIGNATLYHGDCLEVMRTLPDCSVDAVVTDPPYGLSFMGKRWDYDVPSVEVWAECLRVLKPGGHLLAFAGTRTQHRMAVRIEDAGFEIRDMIAWVYGSGFPKSHNLKDDWQGWGTALKPALEPITVGRKPLIGTVAENVLTHGTGALNIDGCRVGLSDCESPERLAARSGGSLGFRKDGYVGGSVDGGLPPGWDCSKGRWPANLIHDGSDEVVGLTGDAARFFYCAKASKADRDEGCEGLEKRVAGGMSGRRDGSMGSVTMSRNIHPTVKPTALMQYLCRLVTPSGGTVLDPFMGSGSTGKAARLEGANFIGIEREHDYLKIAHARIEAAELTLGLFK